MNTWKLNEQGFVSHYMVSGPKDVPYFNETKDNNQLRLEAYLRSVVADHEPVTSFEPIRIGENSRLGMPWTYTYSAGSGFVNVSEFYSVMRKITFDAATVLEADEDCEAGAVLWSYAAADIYCNGTLIGTLKQPVYKPIQKLDLTLSLKKGRNLIYMAGEHLGVRDTRSVFGLQITDQKEKIHVALADETKADAIFAAEAFLQSAVLKKDVLYFEKEVPAGSDYHYPVVSEDFAEVCKPTEWIAMPEDGHIALKNGKAMITVRTNAGGVELSRTLERTEQIVPQYVDREVSFEENKELIFRRIADVMSLSRGEKFGFPISDILARKHFGDKTFDDERLLDEMLEMIEDRYDCSDFLMCGLIRLVKEYPIENEAQKKRIDDIMLNYRYWMDMDGFDGMCFWSENHALMFYACAMQAGEMYPDSWFTRANMYGRDLYTYGRNKVLQWLDDVEEYGFEEFLSTVYMCVTFAGLINVVDYSDEEISRRAAAITDKLLSMLSLHTFKNGIVAPMGNKTVTVNLSKSV